MSTNLGSTGTEQMDIDYWVYNRLLTDVHLSNLGLNRKVYDGIAPMDASFPFIIFQWQGGHDVGVLGTGTGRLMSSMMYVIKVITESLQTVAVKPFTDRVNELFTCPIATQTLTLDDGSTWRTDFSSRRVEPFVMMEQDGGRIWRHQGGVYEIISQSWRTSPPTV